MLLLTGLPGLAFAADKMTDAQIQEKLKAGRLHQCSDHRNMTKTMSTPKAHEERE